MRARHALAVVPLSAAVLAVPLAVVVAQPGGAASPGLGVGIDAAYPYPAAEVAAMKTLRPAVRNWSNAIDRRDLARALDAAQQFEITWQGVEAWTNHRSLPMYEDLEHDTQFVISDELELPNPDWRKLRQLVRHLSDDVEAAIAMSAAGPKLSPLFEDLAKLRGARAYVNVAGAAVDAGDVAKARSFLAQFESRFPGVEGFIAFRSQTALDEAKAALAAFRAELDKAAPDPAALKAAKNLFTARLGFGVNLLNAAARAAVAHKTSFDTDKPAVTVLHQIADALRSADPAVALGAAKTGPGSLFAGVQPVLEAKGRLLNTAASLRTALAALESVLSQAAPAAADVAAAQRRAYEQLAIARQALVGQFWGDAGLTAFLASLPAL